LTVVAGLVSVLWFEALELLMARRASDSAARVH
jgi:hypothetical protein